MIIGISGKRGTGKDSLADELVNKHNFMRIGFADPMKRFLALEFEFSNLQLNGPSEMREMIDPRFGRSAREMLQTLGTEWGRKLVHPDIWVRTAIRRAEVIMSVAHTHTRPVVGVVISDVRFPNEFYALREAGATLVRLTRKDRPASSHDAHESESALDEVRDEAFDYCIANDGTKLDLAEHAKIVVDSRT